MQPARPTQDKNSCGDSPAERDGLKSHAMVPGAHLKKVSQPGIVPSRMTYRLTLRTSATASCKK